jgi:hypothetical protein
MYRKQETSRIERRLLRRDLLDLLARDCVVVRGNSLAVPVCPCSETLDHSDVLQTTDDGLGGNPGVEDTGAVAYHDAVILGV